MECSPTQTDAAESVSQSRRLNQNENLLVLIVYKFPLDKIERVCYNASIKEERSEAMVKRKSMMFYYDWRNILIDSFEGNYDTIGRIVMALLNYAERGDMPENLDDREMIAFNFMYGQVDRDSEKYEERVERNRRNALKRNEAKELTE